MQLSITAAALNGVEIPRIADSAAAALARYVPLDSAVVLIPSPRQVWHVGWMIAAYHASLGDTALSRRWRVPLGLVQPGVLTLREYPKSLVTDLDARLAERRGDLAAALTAASRALELWDVHSENTYDALPEPVMRLHAALLLEATGKADSAAKLFASLVPPTTWVGLTTARAWYELGRIAETARDCATAAPRYASARRIWELGGAELGPWLERARAGERRCGSAARE
jgi:hypothetical protein